jgi:predicted transposase YdaD
MPGEFDDILKNLTEWSSRDWVIRGGWTSAPTRVIDADIATISGAADKVIRVTGSPDWLLSVDFQAGHDTVAKLADLLLYNSALYKRHKLRVRTLLVLLHPDADSPQVTGLYERGFPGEPSDVTLRYQIVRVWQVPAEKWLKGGLGLLPLAPLGAMQVGDLPGVIARMKQRLGPKVPRQKRKELWSATNILMGLRFGLEEIKSLLQGVVEMKESVTYQAILNEGRAEGEANEARKILLLLGREQLGEPSANQQAALDAITDTDQLNDLIVRLKHAASWQELLGSRRRLPRRKANT